MAIRKQIKNKMEIIGKSYFKKPEENIATFKAFVSNLEQLNGYRYDKITVQTSLGKTQVYGLNTNQLDRKTLVIFPGFRTTSLIWDLDKGLEALSKTYRIFMVETNGQPNLSDGNVPSIRSLDYGRWGEEVLNELKIDETFIAGASFGGLICMKIAIFVPNRIKGIVLLNPGCFRLISFGAKNMLYNILPILKPNRSAVLKFLNKVVLNKPTHQISNEAETLLVDYLLLAIQHYKDNTEKPYYMKSQLDQVKVDTYLVVGEEDILFPHKKSVANAKKHLKDYLKVIKIEKAAHGIELYPKAIQHINDWLSTY